MLPQRQLNQRIGRIETFDVLYPAAAPFKFLDRPRGLAAGRPTVVVKLTTDDGEEGWGQAVPSPRWSYETCESVRSTIDRYLAPQLIGQPIAEFAVIESIMNREIAPSFSVGQPIAKSAIDMALHDLVGKLTGQSIAEMWQRSGSREIELSWTLNPADLDVVAAEIQRASDLGYRSFNVKIGPDPRNDRPLCELVRRLAPKAFLWADANGGYDEAAARSMLPELENLGFAAIEQPLPANRLTGYGRLKTLGILPILMDEGIVSHVELEEFESLGLLDGVAMKVARCGGLLEAARIMHVIEDRGLLFFGSGLTDPDLALAASLALFAAYRLPRPAALNAPQFLTSSILRAPYEVTRGTLRLAAGPGLGVEVDEDKMRGLRA